MNTPAEYARVSEVYAAVFDLPRLQRDERLADLCRGDDELRHWVEDLLAADEAVQAADTLRGTSGVGGLAAAAFGLPREQRHIAAGTMAAGRYRIASLIGRGGSGEVYAADDLLLEQTVALKFLAPSQHAKARAEALLEEVRMARKVRHPNVCQVFDVGEAEGERFVSMEHIRGPNLAEELRRMGRFAAPKAVHLAHQLCAGLMAIHRVGVVHGDLKPANIMLDERGDVRILDFGISVGRGSASSEQRLLGTPAYLAPERWQDSNATVASDVYALGLVLYEIFSGVRAVFAVDASSYRSEHESRVPPHLSSVAEDVDGTVESIIERCLAKDPAQRPSVLEVARALPGGDALGALVLAGVVPTAERVAEGGTEARLSRPVAVAVAFAFAVLLGVAALLMPRVHLVEGSDLPVAPLALADRAAALLRDLGYPPPLHAAHGFGVFSGDPEILFWYRRSPTALLPNVLESSVELVDPPFTEAGMIAVVLAPDGLLRSFVSLGGDRRAVDDEGDAAFLFRRAGLAFDRFTPAVPAATRPLGRGTALAWVSASGEPPLRVEASEVDGRLVYFEVIESGHVSLWASGQPRPESRRAVGSFTLLFAAVALAGAAFFAQGNFRRGVVDRLGARRTAIAMLVLGVARGFTDLVNGGTSALTLRFLFFALERAALFSTAAWIFYAALEPFFRRYWPHALISWTRLVRGRFTDPILGRDVLVGACIGCAALIAEVVQDRVAESVAVAPHLLPTIEQMSALSGAWGALGAVLAALLGAVVLSWVQFSLLVLLRRLLGPGILKIAVFALLITAGNALFDPLPWPALIVQFVFWTIAAQLFVHYGFTTMVAAAFVFLTMTHLPTTLDPSQWYFATSVTGFALLLALVAFALYAALAPERRSPVA